jgi:hypothetical protein
MVIADGYCQDLLGADEASAHEASAHVPGNLFFYWKIVESSAK